MWGHSVRVMRVAGFDIKIDASWVLIAALIVWSLSTGYFPTILPAARPMTLFLDAVFAMLGLFASLVLHELAHSIVARRHGLQISGITLFLFGGVAELETEPQDPTTEIRVAIAGPIASMFLAACFGALGTIVTVLGWNENATAVLTYLATINLILALFNLIPALPLDGGRVYRAVLWRRSGDLLEATRRAATASATFAWLLILLGGMSLFSGSPAAGIWPILLGFFLLALGRASYRRVELNALFQGRVVAEVMTRTPVTVHPDQSLAETVNQVFLSDGVTFAPIVEQGVLLGYIDLDLIRRIDRENWPTTTVNDVMEGLSNDHIVSPDFPVRDLLDRMTVEGRRKFLVVENGRLRGVITLSDLMAYLDISRQVAAAR